MRAFDCPYCGELVSFEDFTCPHCGTSIGFETRRRAFVVDSQHVSRCFNAATSGCNWVVPPSLAGDLCLSCRLTRTRPHDADLAGDPEVSAAFIAAEGAKRRLVFQLLELGLAFDSVSFDLLQSKMQPVTTGHADGHITLDLAEFDNIRREQLRKEFAEPYRTLLGHMRHEVGHYYWQQFVAPSEQTLGVFRGFFGDERIDYRTARGRHYAEGPPPGWQDEYVSAYATMHPWEDWAETFAHYLHIRDTLQTAASFGVIVAGPRLEPSRMAAPPAYPERNFDDILSNWTPLTNALNAINRSMGHSDLYPFVLTKRPKEKLAFVHELVVRRSEHRHR